MRRGCQSRSVTRPWTVDGTTGVGGRSVLGAFVKFEKERKTRDTRQAGWVKKRAPGLFICFDGFHASRHQRVLAPINAAGFICNLNQDLKISFIKGI